MEILVSDLKACVQNAKLFFTQTSGHFQTSELWKVSELQKIFSEIFFDKNVFRTIFFQRVFNCFEDRYTVQ